MKLYFDSAYVAKCYLNEPDGKAVRKLARSSSALYSSAWAIAELACVFLRHVRERALTNEAAAQMRGLFAQDVADRVWRLLPVTDLLLHRVEAELRTFPADTPLRAGDAVHLVTAREAGFGQIWTNDRHLLRAAPSFGIQGTSI